MKLIAYISIFLILSPSLSFGGANAAAQRLLGSIKNRIAKSPVGNQRKRGRAWNPILETTVRNPRFPLIGLNRNSTSSSNGSTQLSGSEGLSNRRRSGTGNLTTPNLNSQSNTRRENIPGRERPPSNRGQNPDGSSERGQSFGLWWPVCLFVDGPNANSQITEMVKMSADCGVNLKPYVRKVSVPDPHNPDQLNSLQSQSCNLKEAGIAPKGSSLFLTTKSSTVADKMCGAPDKTDSSGMPRPSIDVAGCNQLANGASRESRQRSEGHQGAFGGFASGEVALGIVDLQGYSGGDVYSHEAMGHGQMGWPNGRGAGNGIGNPNDPNDRSEDHTHGGGYTSVGCAQMRASAIPDPRGVHKYYASKKRYYNPNARKLMPLGEPIWKKFKGEPSIPNLANNNPVGSPRGVTSDEGTALGTAGAGHKKTKKLASNANRNRTGGGQSSRPGNTQRGDGSPDEGGSAVTGGLGGPGEAKNTITVNTRAKEIANAMDGGSSLDKNFFETSQAQGGKGDSSLVSERISAGSSSESVRGGSSDFSELGRSNEAADKWQPDPDFFKYAKNNPGGDPSSRTIRTSNGTPSSTPPLRSLASATETPNLPNSNSTSAERLGVQRGVKKGQVLFDTNL